MNKKVFWPFEIVNKILIMSPTRPISLILKPCINSYIGSDDNGEYYFSICVYTLDEILNVKLYNNVNNEIFQKNIKKISKYLN